MIEKVVAKITFSGVYSYMPLTKYVGIVQLLTSGFSWLVSALTLLVGIFGFALFTARPIYPSITGWVFVFGSALLGFVPLIAFLTAMRNRKRAGILFLLTAGPMGVCLASEDWRLEFPIVAAGCFVILGLFSLLIYYFDWSPLLKERSARATLVRRVLVAGSFFSVCMLAGVAASLWLLQFALMGHCDLPPFASKRSPNQAVFIGKSVYVSRGRSDSNRHWLACWSVARVDKRFWGVRVWEPNYVILRGCFPVGEDYFIDASRDEGLITRFLPIFLFVECTKTTQLRAAEIELRLMKDGPPKHGVRIIGQLWRLNGNTGNIKVFVSGPYGIQTTTSDKNGIYDIADLPPGQYSISTLADSTLARERYDVNTFDLKTGDIGGGWLHVVD